MFSFKIVRQTSKLEWLLLAAMVGFCLVCRLSFAESWNIKPVAALLMFGAFFFQRSWLPIVGLMIVMVVSDLILGLYHPALMISVYLSMLLAGMIGVLLRRSPMQRRNWAWMTKIVGASLVMSSVFFLLTNGACWLFFDTYPKTILGLISSYAAGLPFFGRTLMGDLFFSVLAFGSYALMHAATFETNRTNYQNRLAWVSVKIEQESQE